MDFASSNRGRMAVEEERSLKLVKLMDETGYPLVQTNGQRVFGPPPGWKGQRPQGCEIFVGKIPRHIFEEELVPLFESCGRIYQLQLMMDFSGLNRGYAFVTYTNPLDAKRAIEQLDNHPIRPRRLIGVCKSVNNCCLFVGGVPQDRSEVEVWNHLKEYVEGIINIIMYPPREKDNVSVNRGYVFVEFSDHKAAAIAKMQLRSGVQLWGFNLTVDWADPLPEVDPELMAEVKRLYIRNVELGLTSRTLAGMLCSYVDSRTICKVYKVMDYAFVHFYQRCDAEIALKALQGRIIFGKMIEVSWARPSIYSKANRMNAPAENFCTSVSPKMRRVVLQHKLKSLKSWQNKQEQETQPSTSRLMSPAHSFMGFSLGEQEQQESQPLSPLSTSTAYNSMGFLREQQEGSEPSTSQSTSPTQSPMGFFCQSKPEQQQGFEPSASQSVRSPMGFLNMNINQPFLNNVNFNMLSGYPNRPPGLDFGNNHFIRNFFCIYCGTSLTVTNNNFHLPFMHTCIH